MSNTHRRRGLITATVGVALVAAFSTACASMPPPTQTMAQAELAVRQAEQAQAQQHAPLDLYQAEEKLQTARRAMANEDYLVARRLAEEALVQAQLAEQKAQTAQAEQAAQELQEGVTALRRETDRASQVRQRELQRYGDDAFGTGGGTNPGGMTE